jgi:hypothetical protein
MQEARALPGHRVLVAARHVEHARGDFREVDRRAMKPW